MAQGTGGVGGKRPDDEAWTLTGDRLVCLEGPDRFTRLSEYRTRAGKRKLIMRCFVSHDEARLIAESFEGEVVWR